MNRKHIKTLAALILCAAAFIFTVPPYSYAQNVPVVQDNGSGSQYDKLPVNYVHITDLDFAHARIESGSGYSIENGYVGSSDLYRANLFWTGKVHFGTANTANDSHAVLRQNALPDVTLRFPGGATLSDGTVCDIRLTLSEVRVGLGKSRTDKITDNTTLKVLIAGGWGCLSSSPPRTNFTTKNATAENGINSGTTTANKYKITMQIVNSGTNTPVSDAYPTMLVEFKDLDVRDKTLKKSAASDVLGNGTYAEGIEMISGWVGNAVIGPATGDMANTVLVNNQITAAGNTRIKVSGAKVAAFEDKYNPPSGDYDTLWSGFVAAVRPQGFSFYWTGSCAGSKTSHAGMGTVIGGQPTVAVKARRNNPGADGATLGGNGTKSGADSWYTNTHLMNSESTYSYTPAPGWYITSLKVDGEEQPLSDEEKLSGGSYTFERLNKYPLPQRDIRNGYVLITKESGFYTIETSYAHLPEYKSSKISDTAYIKAYDDREITYQIRCDEIWEDADAGTYRLQDDMADGLLILSGEPTVTVQGGKYIRTKADSTGLDYTFESDKADGTKPYMLITYKARVNWNAYFESDKPSIINTCNGNTTETRVLSALKITKTVAGNLRDTTKAFDIEISLSGLDPDKEYPAGSGPEFGTGGGAEFADAVSGEITGSGIRPDSEGNAVFRIRLKGGQGIGISDLPVGMQYKVSEGESDHRASYKQTSEAAGAVFAKAEDSCDANHKPLATETETLDKQDGEVTVAFTNTRNTAVVTGITEGLGLRTAAAMSAVLAAAAAAMFLSRFLRKEREADEG